MKPQKIKTITNLYLIASVCYHSESVLKLIVHLYAVTDNFVAPYDEPKLFAESNSSCIFLTLRPPKDKNGVLLHYEVCYLTIRGTIASYSGFQSRDIWFHEFLLPAPQQRSGLHVLNFLFLPILTHFILCLCIHKSQKNCTCRNVFLQFQSFILIKASK